MSFDVLAPHYRWMEVVLAGEKLQRCRTAFLGQLPRCRNVLIIGEGNGRFLVECRQQFQHAHITCVDASARMLEQARARLRHSGLNPAGVDFIHANALNWQPPAAAFDLLVTHFFLDCFGPEQLAQVVGTLATAARPEANWLLADFQVPPAGLRRYRALAIHRLMYWFFCLVARLPARRLTVPDPLLAQHGFGLRERRLSDWDLLHSDWWQRPAKPG